MLLAVVIAGVAVAEAAVSLNHQVAVNAGAVDQARMIKAAIKYGGLPV